jgi:hypothetical protein
MSLDDPPTPGNPENRTRRVPQNALTNEAEEQVAHEDCSEKDENDDEHPQDRTVA